MRGAHYQEDSWRVQQRIIPADAGSTIHSLLVQANQRDHPRGCGEHKTVSSSRMREGGSSPRMRGALRPPQPMTGSARIIPADAGSTGVTMAWLTADEDHPRGCGEHAAIKTDNDGPEGSSPRMRGALSVHHHHSFLSRIIPADAGSTSTASKLIPAGGDHPRGCGEHVLLCKTSPTG